MEPGFLGAMLLLGLASGLHCVGMCGGIVGAFSSQVVHSRKALLARQLAFNLGRIGAYGAAGAAVGLAGSAARYAGFVLSAQTGLYVLANLLLVLVALHVAGLRNPLAWTERLGLPLWRRLQPLAGRLMGARGLPNSFAAGAVWGWLPCGLVYGALGAAAFAGSPARGAAAMAAFGVGTLPYLLAAGLAAARLRALTRRPAVRIAAACGLLGFGAFGLARAAGLAETLNNALLCL